MAAWRSAYPGILPDDYLARLSVTRYAAQYDRQIRAGNGVFVAVASGADALDAARPRLIGYTTVGRARQPLPGGCAADGEIETLYVLDDWRECSVGRRLIRTGAAHLASAGARAAFVWVLTSNPSRWFYQRLGGKPVVAAHTHVGGVAVAQTAYVWDPIERLIAASTAP